MKRERGIRWFCGVGMLLLAAACFFLVWSWIAAGPASAFRHAAKCPADAPASASCLTYGTAVVKQVQFHGSARAGEYYALVLAVPHDATPVTVNGFTSSADLQADAPKLGATVQIELWQGRLMTATSALGTAASGDTPGQDLTVVFSCAMGLLLAAVGCLRFSRPGWFGRPIAPILWLFRAGLIAVLVGIVGYMAGLRSAGIYVAGVGTGAIALWAAAYTVAVFTHDWVRQLQAQPAGAGAKAGSAKSGNGAGKPKQPAEKRPPAAVSRRSARRNQDRRADGCPVSEEDQAWIEKSLYWFTTQFGYDPVQRRTVVPTAEFIPAGYAGTDDDIRRLFALACPLMGTSTERVALRFVGEPALDPEAYRYVVQQEAFAAGVFINDASGYVIELDRENARDAQMIAATIAHELGHVRLNGDKGVDSAREDAERLTDLVTAFFGFGIFTANAAYRVSRTSSRQEIRRLGYMDQRMFGYALACYSRMRRSPRNPPWAEYLDEVPRTAMNHGLEYLAAAAPYGGLPTQRH